MKPDRRLRVGLLWHSVNSANLGIGALTAAHIAILERIAEDLGVGLKLDVIGWTDSGPSYIDNADVSVVPVRFRDLLHPWGEVHKALRRCDLVCDIGAGDSFADIYGVRRFLSIALSQLAVSRPRQRLILSPQTIGPFERWWTRIIARRLMTRCRAVVVRDALSLQAVGTIKARTEVIEATDVAFRLPYRPVPAAAGGAVRVGLNISGLLFHGGYTRQNMFELVVDYPRLVRALLEWFDRKPGCEVHLISHVISDSAPIEDDYRVARQLAADFPRVRVAPRFSSPSAAKSYISGMNFFCGSRMHACIAALSSGVPTVPLSYSRKFTGLFESVGYPLVADCKTEGEEQILEKVRSAFHQREALKARAQAARARAGDKLRAYETLLATRLGQIESGKR